MQPDAYTYNQSAKKFNPVKLIAGLLAVLVLVLIGYAIYDSMHLRLKSTNPTNQTSVTSFTLVTFNFNKNLDQSAADTFSIDPKVDGTVEVKGKQLIFTPKSALNVDAAYTAQLNNPTAGNGKYSAGMITLSFTSIFDPSAATPQMLDGRIGDDSSALIITGTDALINDGVSSKQIENLRAALKTFKPSVKTFDINTASIDLHSASRGNPQSTVNFKITGDGTTYNAVLDYTDVNAIQLKLSDSTGKQIFDSGVVDQ
jgi:hypothetical protein